MGIQRREYLYDLTYCDMVVIERGYFRRNRDMWSSTRWATYYIMASFVGSDSLAKSGIHSPKDLISFPWEKKTVVISEDERKSLMNEIAMFNKLHSKPQS